MVKKRLVLSIMGMIFFIPSLYAGSGGEEGAFLKRGMGARALALGKSYCAIADESSAVYWNPAGLAQMKEPEISLMYSEPYFRRVEGIGYHTLSFAQPLGRGAIGAGLVYLGVAWIEKYDESGKYVGTFQNIEEALFLSYGHKLGDKFSLGTSFKGVHQEIDKYSGNGFGLDVGSLYRPYPNLKIGLLLQDLIGPTLNLAGKGEPFPLKAHLGMSYRIGGPHWLNRSGILFTIGAMGKTRDRVKPRGGLEFQIIGTGAAGEVVEKARMKFQSIGGLAIRAGYDGVSEEIGIGAGIEVIGIKLDYNYCLHQLLKETHQVSLGIKF